MLLIQASLWWNISLWENNRIIWRSKQIRNLQRVTHVQSGIVQPCKNTLLIPKNKEYCIEFFCTFVQTKTILICIQSLILSTDRPKQTIALSLEKSTTDILFPLFIFQSTYSPLFKIKLSFNEQRSPHCIVLIY